MYSNADVYLRFEARPRLLLQYMTKKGTQQLL